MKTLTTTPNDKQRTDEWLGERMGRFTASEFHRLMTEPRSKADKDAGKLSQGAITYVMEKVAERITGKPAKDEFESKYTQWGEDHEPLAKSIYEAVFDRKVTLSGFIEYVDHAGGSPDGLVLDDGILEIKCPYTITAHLKYLMFKSPDDLKSEMPEYYWQCLGYMLITGREWCDFISYHPHFPARLQLKRVTIARAAVTDDIVALSAKLDRAKEEFNSLLNFIKK